MKACSLKDQKLDLVFINNLMAIDMKVIGLLIKEMELVNRYTTRFLNLMKEVSFQIFDKEKESTYITLEIYLRDSGKMT